MIKLSVEGGTGNTPSAFSPQLAKDGVLAVGAPDNPREAVPPDGVPIGAEPFRWSHAAVTHQRADVVDGHLRKEHPKGKRDPQAAAGGRP